jgi:hypothetical protein
MKHEILMDSNEDDLNAYAQVLGVNIKSKKSIAAKVAAIETAYKKSVEIEIFGHPFVVAISRAHDQRCADILGKTPLSDEDVKCLLQLLLGDEQYSSLYELCTDEDGVVDASGLAVAMTRLMTSDKLKKF